MVESRPLDLNRRFEIASHDREKRKHREISFV